MRKLQKPHKISTPEDPGTHSPRSPGFVDAEANHRRDPSDSSQPLRGRWPTGEWRNPENPAEIVLGLIEEAKQNERDGLRLIAELDRALIALGEWDPTYQNTLSSAASDDAQRDQPRPEYRASAVVMGELLRHLTQSVDEEILAVAGLQRRKPPGPGRAN